MFEKDATEYAIIGWDKSSDPRDVFTPRIDETKFNDWRNGAEFGYNFAKEEIDYLNKHWRSEEERKDDGWHYVKDGDYPKEKGNYLVAWKRTHHVEEYGKWGFDVDLFNADEGYFEGVGDYVIAWKEIVLPELPKEIE